MPFKAYYLTAEGDLRRDLGEEEVRAAYESRQGLLWVDVTGDARGGRRVPGTRLRLSPPRRGGLPEQARPLTEDR